MSKETILPEDIEALSEQYKEIALSIRRSMFLLVSFSVFSLGVMFVPDEYLIQELGKSINISLVGLPLPVSAFIFIAPIFLIVITSYFNIFIKELSKIHAIPQIRQFPLFIVIDDKRITLIKWYLSVVNVPVIMIAYCWKISPHPLAIIFFTFTFIVIGSFIGYSYINTIYAPRYKQYFIGFIISITSAVVMFITYSSVKKDVNIFTRGYNLDRIVFEEKLNLTNVNFSKVSLKYAYFNNVNMKGINFDYADLTGATLRGADLKNSNMLEAGVKNADLFGADISSSYLVGADFRFSNLEKVDFSQSNLDDANFSGATLTNSNFKNASLIGASLISADLTNANLRESQLMNADFERANLTNVNLFDADLSNASLRGASFVGVNLKYSTLVNSDLSDANLKGADFSGVDLSGANLARAKLYGADLRGANLSGANLKDTELRDAVLICGARFTCEQLVQASQWERSYRIKSCGKSLPEYSLSKELRAEEARCALSNSFDETYGTVDSKKN